MPCTTQNSQQAGLEYPFTLLDPSGNSTPATQSVSHPPTPAPMSSTQQGSTILTPDFPRLSINSSNTTPPNPNPNPRNLTHFMVPTPENFTISFYSANTTS